MADVEKLMQLSRANLNELAKQKNIEDADNETKYPTKRPLAEVVAQAITPEEFEAFMTADKEPTPPKDDVDTNEPVVDTQTPDTDEPTSDPAEIQTPLDDFIDDEDDVPEERVTDDLRAKIRRHYDSGANYQALADKYRLTVAEVEEIVVSGQEEAAASK